MKTDLRKVGDVIIVDLEGRLVGGAPAEILRDTLNQLVAEGRTKILLNLSKVDWIDSSGIGELISGIRLAERFRSAVKLLRVGDRVKHVLSISRLLPLLDVYEDEEEALKVFGQDS